MSPKWASGPSSETTTIFSVPEFADGHHDKQSDIHSLNLESWRCADIFERQFNCHGGIISTTEVRLETIFGSPKMPTQGRRDLTNCSPATSAATLAALAALFETKGRTSRGNKLQNANGDQKTIEYKSMPIFRRLILAIFLNLVAMASPFGGFSISIINGVSFVPRLSSVDLFCAGGKQGSLSQPTKPPKQEKRERPQSPFRKCHR